MCADPAPSAVRLDVGDLSEMGKVNLFLSNLEKRGFADARRPVPLIRFGVAKLRVPPPP